MTIYVDTSAAAKLLSDETEANAVAEYLDSAQRDGARIVSSVLLETEMRRFALRTEIDQELVTEHLDRYALLVPDPSLYRLAGLLGESSLRSLDALHLAAAIRLNATRVLTYDMQQAKAARALGLTTESPA